MGVVINDIQFNWDAPAAPSGHSNIVFQDDGGAPRTKVSAYDPNMVGDAGSGGYPGNVPAPGAGDAAAGKYLDASGAWSVPTPTPATQGWSSGTGGLGSAGYWEKNPLGRIEQWGTINTDIAGGALAVTFPINFTNAGSINVQVTTKSSTDRITFVVDGSTTVSGFTISNNGTSGYAYWRATGY
jgi:hypothetical protein